MHKDGSVFLYIGVTVGSPYIFFYVSDSTTYLSFTEVGEIKFWITEFGF